MDSQLGAKTYFESLDEYLKIEKSIYHGVV